MATNVTVITQIASSRDLTNSLKYTNSKDPHYTDSGQIKHRDLNSWGINCSNDPNLAKVQMLKTLHNSKVGRHNIHDITEVKSFKGFDYHNPHDRKTVIKLDSEMMKAEHPHCQVFCQLQADGKGHHLHVHNHVCPRQFTDFKSITGKQMSIRYYIKPISDRIMKAHNFGTLNYHQSKRYRQHQSLMVKYHAKHGGSWVEAIRHKLNYYRLHSTSIQQYATVISDDKDLKPYWLKMHTVNGKKMVHFYKTGNLNNFRILKVPKGKDHYGEYVHLRKHFSYEINYKGHRYKIRDKTLGSDFVLPNLLKQFQLNRQRMIHPSSKVASNNRIRSNSKQSQQSDGIQPVMIRAKNNESDKNDMGSIKHSFKLSSVARANKLLKYVHMNTFTINGYTKRATKTKSGKVIPLSDPVPVKARSFHFPVIHLPNKPVMPIFQFLNISKDTETVRAMEARLNSDKMDQYRQRYNDYMSAKDARSEAINANRDMDAQTRQTNMDTAKDAHEKHSMLIKEIRARNNGISR